MTIAGKPVRLTQGQRTALSDKRMTSAAVDLLVVRGVVGTTLAAVGELAGYSRGLATYRFGSKAGLFAHVLRELGRDWGRRLHAAVGGRTGLAAIHRAVDALAGMIAEEPREIRAMYLLWFQSIDPGAEYRADVATVHEAQRHDLERWVREGQQDGEIDSRLNPRRAAEMMAVSIAGLVFHWMVNPSLPIAAMHQQLKKDISRQLGGAAQR